MTVVGIDAHKDWHAPWRSAMSAVLTVEARAGGHRPILSGQFKFAQVAVEDCRHLTRRPEADRLNAGHCVVRVHTKLMAPANPGRAPHRDAVQGPLVPARDRPRPYMPLPGHLRRYRLLAELLKHFDGRPGAVAEIARDLLEDIRSLTPRINDIEKRLTGLVAASHPGMFEVPGLGVLGAAMIVGETAGARRFKSKDSVARFNGTPDPDRVGQQGSRQTLAWRQPHY